MLLHIDCRGIMKTHCSFVCCVLVVRIMYAHHLHSKVYGKIDVLILMFGHINALFRGVHGGHVH